jgi:hypothetical protein
VPAVAHPNPATRCPWSSASPAPRQWIAGRYLVATTFVRFLQVRRVTLDPTPVNAEPGALAHQDGRLIAVAALSVRDGLIAHIHAIANPEKLADVASLLGAPTAPLLVLSPAG